MSRGYSVAQTARLVCALRWTCGRLSEMLRVWAAQAAEAGGCHAGAAVRLAELGRRLASHRETLDGLQPDSELMAPWRQAAPASRALAEALDAIAAMGDPSERVAIASTVVLHRLASAYGEIDEHAASHCDAALASAVRALRRDLDEDGSPPAGAQSGVVEAADRVLAAAGGIVGPSVLKPEDFA